MHSPSTSFLTQLAVAKDVASALQKVDDALFAAFRRAVAYAEEVLPDYTRQFGEAETLLILHEDVGLIVCFHKKQERYYVVAVIFGDDDSPDPGCTQSVRIGSGSLIEQVLSACNLPSAIEPGQLATEFGAISTAALAPCVKTASGNYEFEVKGLGLIGVKPDSAERGTSPRSVVLWGKSVMRVDQLRQTAKRPSRDASTLKCLAALWVHGRREVSLHPPSGGGSSNRPVQ